MNIEELDQALKAVCPIDGVSIGVMDDPATWRIDFKKEATDDERAAAHSVLNGVNTIEPSGLPEQPTKAGLQAELAALAAKIAALP